MEKDLVKYFIDQVKEQKMLDDLFKESVMDIREFLKGKPTPYSVGNKKKINYGRSKEISSKSSKCKRNLGRSVRTNV